MNTLLEKYRKATSVWVTAPSGIEYRIRGIAAIEYGALLKAMPALVGLSNGNGSAPENRPDDKEINARLMAIVSCGVTMMRWDGEETSEIPSPEEFPAKDVAFVAQKINEASGISGAEAQEAGRSL